MSQAEKEIVCRQCREIIPFAPGDGCPHCGRSMRDRWKWGFVLVVGVILTGSSIAGGLIEFALLGLVLTGIGGAVLYDQWQRIQRAEERRQEGEGQGADDSEGGAETAPSGG